MARFEFALQSALDLRRREEEAALHRFAQARRLARGILAELRDAQVRHDDLADTLRALPNGPGAHLRLAEIEHAHRCLANLRHAMVRLHERLRQADRLCKQRQAEAMAAAQARRTLERLAQRQEAEHRCNEVRREQRELDEAALVRHQRLQMQADRLAAEEA
ncbi:MAG: flagellar export protein FliJ [Armatimonadota bacterium]